MNKFTLIDAAALAYLGDCVIELEVRRRLIEKGYEKSATLNAEARKFVTAVAQSKALAKIGDLLNEEENGITRRARNSSHLNIPKSATPKEYKSATSFEAVFGYLYMTKDEERIKYLFETAYSDILSEM